jgi:hypothetical protein
VLQHRAGVASPALVSAKPGVVCSLWGLIAAKLRAKGAKSAALKKVMSFVFKHFLASFPRFS